MTRVLFIGGIWPQEQASAASNRTLSLIQASIDAGHQVWCSADEREHEATATLRHRGIHCQRLAPNDAAFAAFLSSVRPDVVVFDRFTSEEKFSWRVREVCPDAIRVLDTIDLHGLRLARMLAQQSDAAAFSTPLTWAQVVTLAGDTALREIAAIYRCDLSLVTSDTELSLLTTEGGLPAELLHLCRLTYAPPMPQRDFSARHGYTCLGNFRHPPNADAVQWLKQEIWPLIRRLQPEAQLEVWGAHAKPHQMAWSDPAQGFCVRGYAQDPGAALAGCRVNLAPLRFGAGIKGKIADGWWWGAPAVSTWIGAEGMHEGWPFGGLIAATAAEIAEAAVRLHQDQALWQQAALAGSELITRLYSKAATTQALMNRIASLAANLTTVRTRNVTGQVLWQQGLRSTEYFSRWIELKRQHGQQVANHATNERPPTAETR